ILWFSKLPDKQQVSSVTALGVWPACHAEAVRRWEQSRRQSRTANDCDASEKNPETFRGGSGKNRWKRNSPEPKTMKTNAKSFLILFALITVAFIPARADFINSTYTGPTDGNWGDPANWSPAIVPNNGGGNTYAATIANVFLTLDLDVTVSRLTFNPGDGNPIIVGGTAPLLDSLDHNFTSAHTSVGDGG